MGFLAAVSASTLLAVVLLVAGVVGRLLAGGLLGHRVATADGWLLRAG